MKKRILAVAVTSMLLSASVFAQETVVPSRVGDLKFESDFPTQETMKNMLNEMDFQRATQAYLWGIPASSIMEWLNVSVMILNLKKVKWVSSIPLSKNKALLPPTSQRLMLSVRGT